ncbi:MAG: DNA primase [Haloferacaceae archaeon]
MDGEVDPLDARYPYFASARETVKRLDVAPPELAAADAPAVERGTERVRRALVEGTVAPAEPERWRPRDELLSYPVARVLVSLVESEAAVRKYAAAEAATARERLVADFGGDDGLRTGTERADLDAVLREFDLAGDVTPLDDRDRFRVGVGAYLRLVTPSWGDRWRLVNRALHDGALPVEREELHRLLEEAVRRRVAEGLPVPVGGEAGEALAAALDDEVAAIRRLLDDHAPRPDVDVVAPDRFPPCVRALVERARAGEDLPPRSTFALVAFLADLGADTEEVVSLTGLDPDAVEFPTAVLADDGRAQYPAPSCATMDAQGDCVNTDERCETVAHPLAYYREAVADGGTAGEDEDDDGGTGSDAGADDAGGV